jgi:adenylate kinase family enzyme
MIVIINGAPGTGKSKTAELLNEKIKQSAWIDGDWMLRINPRKGTDEERKLRYEQISKVAKTYYEKGYTNIIISFVYPGPTSLSQQISFLSSIDDVVVVSLITNSEELQRRHSTDSYKREDIESSIELNNKIKQLSNSEFIDNTAISIQEVVEEIIVKFKHLSQ